MHSTHGIRHAQPITIGFSSMKINDKNVTEDNPKTPVDPELMDARDQYCKALQAKHNLLSQAIVTALAARLIKDDGLKILNYFSLNIFWIQEFKDKYPGVRSMFFLTMNYGKVANRVGIIPTEENYKAIVALSKALPENQKQAWEESGAESADRKKILAVIKEKNYGKPNIPSKRVKELHKLFLDNQNDADFMDTKMQIKAELEAIKNDKLGIKILNTKELEDLYKLMADTEQGK